jgi:hypothetical protein
VSGQPNSKSGINGWQWEHSSDNRRSRRQRRLKRAVEFLSYHPPPKQNPRNLLLFGRSRV